MVAGCRDKDRAAVDSWLWSTWGMVSLASVLWQGNKSPSNSEIGVDSQHWFSLAVCWGWGGGAVRDWGLFWYQVKNVRFQSSFWVGLEGPLPEWCTLWCWWLVATSVSPWVSPQRGVDLAASPPDGVSQWNRAGAAMPLDLPFGSRPLSLSPHSIP